MKNNNQYAEDILAEKAADAYMEHEATVRMKSGEIYKFPINFEPWESEDSKMETISCMLWQVAGKTLDEAEEEILSIEIDEDDTEIDYDAWLKDDFDYDSWVAESRERNSGMKKLGKAYIICEDGNFKVADAYSYEKYSEEEQFRDAVEGAKIALAEAIKYDEESFYEKFGSIMGVQIGSKIFWEEGTEDFQDYYYSC